MEHMLVDHAGDFERAALSVHSINKYTGDSVVEGETLRRKSVRRIYIDCGG